MEETTVAVEGRWRVLSMLVVSASRREPVEDRDVTDASMSPEAES